MPIKSSGGTGLGVVAGDILALRGTGLAAAETWALLCQAAQALQDLFLSNGGVVDGSRAGPVVTPHTIELTARGKVMLLQAPPDTARAYLPPEYRPGRVYSDTDSEKMWMYSLGRALLDTTPRDTALTGTVSVSPSSALQSVLAAMTEPDPRRRASLMNLLDVISEYCRTRLQSRPFTHIVMDMYREVVRSPQYLARQRALEHQQSPKLVPCIPTNTAPTTISQQQLYYPSTVPVRQNPPQSRQRDLFREQSRNSRSQPNLLSLADPSLAGARSIAEGPSYAYVVDARNLHQRTNSQPDCCVNLGTCASIPQARSSGNLAAMASTELGCTSTRDARHANNPYSGDTIYSMPVKPFLSSQDVRNANAIGQFQRTQICSSALNYLGNAPVISHIAASPCSEPKSRLDNGICEQARSTPQQEDPYSGSSKQTSTRSGKPSGGGIALQRQHSSPQFSMSARASGELEPWECSPANQQPNSDVVAGIPYTPRGPPPPKPPRIITSLKKAAAAQAQMQLAEDGHVVEDDEHQPRNMKNGPKARRGRAVQRAPSRLYKAMNGPTRSFNVTQCVGPEFVVRANQPVKLLTVGDFKMSNIGRLTVIHLTGQRIEVTCDPQKVTAGELFQAIVQDEGLEENFTLGLAALLAGDFAMLPPEIKLNKVAPSGWLNSGKSRGLLGLPTSFMLYMRLKFFLPSPRGLRTWISKHLVYLQIRRCILEHQLVCSLLQLINLTGLALQAEFGDYNDSEHGTGDYFLLEHYVPESFILNSEEQQYRHPQLPDSGEALRKRLQQAHRERRGLDANKAEEMFITHAQTLPDYGSHYYTATVDAKELGKIVARQKKFSTQDQQKLDEEQQRQRFIESENIYDIDKCSDYPIYGRIDFNGSETREQNLQRSQFTDEEKLMLSKNPPITINESQKSSKKKDSANSNSSKSTTKSTSKFKRSDSDVWLAVHPQGLKVFERGPRLRDRIEFASFQWSDIQTLSYGKNYLIVYTRICGKRCKFKLKMDHRKSFYAFKLTSLHHQFFIKLRSEPSSSQLSTKDFGVPLKTMSNSHQSRARPDGTNSIISTEVVKARHDERNFTQLEERQNKENEKPMKEMENVQKQWNKRLLNSCNNKSEEGNILYAQVNARLEPEGESRDTEDETDHNLYVNEKISSMKTADALRVLECNGNELLCNYANIGVPYGEEKEEYIYTIPVKSFATNDADKLNKRINKPEDLYAAINKSSLAKKSEMTEAVDRHNKNIEVKPISIPFHGSNRLNEKRGSPSKPPRLQINMENKNIHKNLQQLRKNFLDDPELSSLKSDSTSRKSTSSPEAYVLNADIKTDDETFRIPDETMSNSLMARLNELSFVEERVLRTIKLERGHGGSIGLQVTEGTDGGVYVQAVSVGGSADMAGNVNKGDRIVAINGQSLLNLRYEDALKMLQTSPETVELVLSQIISIHCDEDQMSGPLKNNYLQNLRFNISSENETAGMMSSKWLNKGADVASVQNTSSAYSSGASSAMGNHNMNSLYAAEIEESNPINSASILLSLEDLDVSRSSNQQVFI
ncbi:hypothetical protein QAD02_010442 [Eretmocerus hayati]|uniref:Uncharacterized protein n=1 Tax=Eretmocerus hayati TaxID=131215 RepID=A0ACC2NV65_9HYME|nr:hypothetical protein QAD02_010442 [Eretmocerus hayati]